MKAISTPLLMALLTLLAVALPLHAQQNFWRSSTGPYGAPNITSIATGPSGSLFVGDAFGLHRSTDAGETWQPIIWQDSLFVGKFESVAVLRNGSPTGIVFGRLWNRIYRTTDNGLTWLGQPVATNDDHVHTVIAAPDGIVYTSGRLPNGGGTLLRSTDGGVTWQSASPIPARDPLLAVDSIGGIAMYDGYTSIYYSSNHGGRWGLVAEGISATALAFQKSGRLLVSTYNKFYRAELVSPEVWRMDSISVTPILGVTTIFTTSKGAIYVAGNGTAGSGVYRSADNGRTWTDVSSGLPVPAVSTLGYHPDGWVYAGTLGGSVVRSRATETGSDVSSVRRADALLQGVALDAVAHPTGERMTVRYSLPASAIVRLDLVSMTGETMATVIEGEARSAGAHSAEIDASAFPAGVYFCRLTVDGASRVVKIGWW